MVADVFLVTRSQGPRWDTRRDLEGQQGWREHAEFMNALAAEGFVALGGPIVDTREVMLVVRANSPEDIRARLALDPWECSGQLDTARVQRWQLRLGALPDKGTPS